MSQSYSKSCLFTVGCTFILTTPFLLTTHCSGLPPLWHMQSFSKNRWGSRGNPTHNISCWHLVESGKSRISLLCSCHDFVWSPCLPDILLWNDSVWGEIHQAIDDNRECFFQVDWWRVLYYWTASESIQPDSVPPGLYLQWTVREWTQAGTVEQRGKDDNSVREAVEDGGT